MIDVLLTFDTEFSIGGALTYPERYTPLGADYVWLESNGESLGLGYIIDCLKSYELGAVFFTEACNAAHHGLNEMGNIAHSIQDAGHDVQLHIHPAWLYFDKQRTWPKNDSCAGRTIAEMQEILEYAIDVYKNWLGKSPLAVRTGSLKVDKSFYSAVQKIALPCSSSIGLSVFVPDDDSLKIMSGASMIGDVVELPVSTSASVMGGKTNLRSLQIQSCSFQEIKYSLEYAFSNKISPVVILSHPFEFVKAADYRYGKYIKNNLVRRRFEQLCLYLAENRQRFRVVSVADCLSKLNLSDGEPSTYLKVPAWSVIKRMFENRVSDLVLANFLKLR